jgi:hypothetical protein
MLRPTVSRPVCPGIKHTSGPYDQIFITVRQLQALLMWGALSDERMRLSFTIAAGPRQRSHFPVRVTWDSLPYFTVSDSRLPFSSPSTTRRATVEVFDHASTWDSSLLVVFLLLPASSESESYVTTDDQPASLSWNKAPIWGLRPDLYYCLTVAGFLILGALSNERTGLSFTIPAGPRQHSHFRIRVP